MTYKNRTAKLYLIDTYGQSYTNTVYIYFMYDFLRVVHTVC